MTVSERAHEIQQINPRISWKDALHQAYEEIARLAMEEEERNNAEDLEALQESILDALSGIKGSHGFNFRSADFLIADLIYNAIQKRSERTKYPATSVMNAIKFKLGIDIVEQVVFSSSGAHNFIAFDVYRESGTGRIRSDWMDDVNRIIRVLGVDPSTLPTYAEVSRYFV